MNNYILKQYKKMLQVNPQNVQMKYSETKMESKIELINPSENIYLSYKIKTANPQVFEIHPSKGYITPGQKRQIQFSTKVNLDQSIVEAHNGKVKFQIQYIVFPQKKKPEQIDELWGQYKERKISPKLCKLKLIINGLKSQTKSTFLMDSRQSLKSTVTNFTQNSINEQQLQQLKQKEAKLQRQRNEFYQQIVKRDLQAKKSKGISPILIFLLTFIIGILFGRLYSHMHKVTINV